jgi:penicillin-binding protein 2
VESWGGEVVAAYGPEVVRKVNLKPQVLEVIRRGMLRAVEEGTGRPSRIPGVRVAGKTGTAQVVKKDADLTGQTKDHGWFTAFAPYEDPEIAIVVIAENAGFGSVAAAPVARAILEAAFGPARDRTTVAQGTGPGGRE